MEFTSILFYIFSTLIVISSVAVITAKNPVYSVLWLVFAFFNSAGIFLILGAEMLAMLLVIVYVGAVAVLFLFVVMMLNIKTATLKKGFQAYLPLGLALAAILFLEISAITYNSSKKLDIKNAKVIEQEEIENEVAKKVAEQIEEQIEKAEEKIEEQIEKAKMAIVDNADQAKEVGEAVQDSTEMIVKIDVDEAEKEVSQMLKKNTNAHKIGNVLYTDYVLYFQTCGLILFVAMIGAIVLTLRHRGGVRKQVVTDQYKRNMKNSLEIVKVKSGEGV